MPTEEEPLHSEQRITLSGFCRQSAPRRRKEYLAYLPIVTTVGNPNVVHVDLMLLKAALRGDELRAAPWLTDRLACSSRRSAVSRVIGRKVESLGLRRGTTWSA